MDKRLKEYLRSGGSLGSLANLPKGRKASAPFPCDPAKVYAKPVDGLALRLKRIGVKDVVVGVSGGLDSALCLLVACDAFASLGLSWALTGQTPLALGTLDSALRDGVATSDPDRGVSPLLLAMGAIQERMSDTEGAEKTFRKMLESDPDNPTALFGIVRARLARGETVPITVYHAD